MSRLISPRDKTAKPRFGLKSSVCLDHCSAQKLDVETVGLVKGSGCFVWLFPCGPVRLLHLSQNQIIGETVFVHMHSFTFPLASFPETLALVVLPLSLKHCLSTNCVIVSCFTGCLLATTGKIAKMLTSKCAGAKERSRLPGVIAHTHTQSTRMARDSFTVLDNTVASCVLLQT